MPLGSDPFFIVGCGRSGTTLLRLLLCRHPRIHIPPETWFILDLVRQLPCGQLLNGAQVQRAIEIIVTSYRWPDFQLNQEELLSQATSLERPRLADIINLVYTRLNPLAKPRFGDKTPPYVQIIPELVQLYPNAKFIHLIRDGRDVAISFLDLHLRFYDRGTRFYEGARFEWTSAIRLAKSYRSSQYAPQILEVRYEDLVSEPASTLAGICRFLGEEFVSEMLKSQSQEAPIPARERGMHAKLVQPISTAALAVWRKKLSGFECFAMEACLKNELRLLSYPLRYDSLVWRAPSIALGALLQVSGPALARGIAYFRRRGLLRGDLYF